ncbi:hypothetical protein AEP_00013 [Curvibacter sp. AEP1-3]|uniref:DUF3619 family protein n=1 Tax=Curvibacter sp. AEP1-3 TaxID=1844971 RepID=UPI000B3C9C12|nr:DUF3619 family protein [Curvibacter sp. AEP1-3]ARV16981.1 hypothetical protein AEP_00013 [Curvibacter sp. AEP1-3]
MTTRKSHRSGAELQETVARAITSRLNEGANALPHDISERLKVARMQALAKRKLVAEAASDNVVIAQAGQATMGMRSGFRNLMTQLGSWLPLLALITGMVVIGIAQDDWTAQEIADVDTELLTDALPPAAYTDPGFAQFLRNNQEK